MAPPRSLRTYSRGNNASISSVDAFNILFAKNLTERKLHSKVRKGKSKVHIKELPKKISTMLSDESSLHVNFNDTFDKVFKASSRNIAVSKNLSVKIISNNTSTSVIKRLSNSQHFSPMLSKLRSYQNKSQNSDQRSCMSWFQNPTQSGERITNELEIEKVEVDCKKKDRSKKKVSKMKQNSSRESPIMLRSRIKCPEIMVTDASSIKKDLNDLKSTATESNESNKKNTDSFVESNLSFNPIFTNSVTEKILVHSSTPLVPNKSKRLVKQPLSPIKTADDEIKSCIFESLEEIKSWEATFPNVEGHHNKNDSLSGIEELKGFGKQDEIDQNELETKREKFVTLRGRPVKESICELEKDKSKSFNLEDFELFYNKFKTRSFKLEDFEQFHNSLRTNSNNHGEIAKFTSRLTQSQVNKLNSISLKDFESFYAAYQNHVSQGSFLGKSHRSINYVTNRKHRISLNKKSINLSKKYIKLDEQFNLKNLVVVLDNILVNNSTSKLRKSRSLCQTALINSIIQKQPVVNLTRLSGNAVKNFKPFSKAKDRFSLNHFKACRKFSSNWTPKRITRSVGSDSLRNSELSDNNLRPDIWSLGQLFINITRMPLNIENISSETSHIRDANVTNPNALSSIDRSLRINRSFNKETKSNSKSEKEDNSEGERSVNTIPKGKKSSSSKSPSKRYSKTVECTPKESLSNNQESGTKKITEKGRKSEPVDFEEIYSSDEKTRIQLFLHSESLEEAVNRKSNGKKEYIAKILVGSVSDTELDRKDSNKSLLREISKTFFGFSQDNIHNFSNSSELFKTYETTKSLPSLNTCESPLKVAEQYHKPSPTAMTHTINSRKSRLSRSNISNTYSIQDLSGSILVNEHNDSISLRSSNSRRESENGQCNSDGNETKTKNTEILNIRTPEFVYSKRKTLQDKCTPQLQNSPKKSVSFNSQSIAPTTPANNSIRSDDDLVESSFVTPDFKATMALAKMKQKVLNLKAGKLWRRSLLMHRRESVIDLTQTSNNRSSNCNKISYQSPLMHQNSSVRRQSIRVVPLCDPRLSRRKTALQTYAQTNLSTVLDDSVTEIENLTPIKPKLSHRSSLPLISAKDIVLKRCGQTEPLPFQKLYPNSLLKDCKKIGEGVYGEVFLYSNPCGDTTVMKVIPIEGDKIVNGERQKKFDEILSEIVIASELSKLRKNTANQTSAFSEVQRICCVKGKYPKTLLDLWNAYDIAKGSENDPPGIFEDDQLYIVLDLANGGRDLEAFVFNNALQAVSMFKQVSCALAVAEQNLQFEHRDLHWGNVLLKSVDKNKKITCKLKGNVIESQTQGVEVTIIDFTLSRIVHDGVVIFNDLGQDPDLFEATGDYQFEIYRLMKKHNSNNWQNFEPYTNVLWLHYILKKSVTALRYKNAKTKIHKKNIDCLKEYENVILDFKSVSEFVSAYF